MSTQTVKALATASVVLLLGCDFALALASGGGPGGGGGMANPLGNQADNPAFYDNGQYRRPDCRGNRHRVWRHHRWYC